MGWGGTSRKSQHPSRYTTTTALSQRDRGVGQDEDAGNLGSHVGRLPSRCLLWLYDPCSKTKAQPFFIRFTIYSQVILLSGLGSHLRAFIRLDKCIHPDHFFFIPLLLLSTGSDAGEGRRAGHQGQPLRGGRWRHLQGRRPQSHVRPLHRDRMILYLKPENPNSPTLRYSFVTTSRPSCLFLYLSLLMQ